MVLLGYEKRGTEIGVKHTIESCFYGREKTRVYFLKDRKFKTKFKVK